MEWTITIEGRNEFGEVCRKQIQIDNVGSACAVTSGCRSMTIMKALQSAVVNQEMETFALFRRVCPDCHTFRPVKDYTKRRIRTVFGTVGNQEPAMDVVPGLPPGDGRWIHRAEGDLP